MYNQQLEVLTALVCSSLISYFIGGISNFTFIAGWLFAVMFTILFNDKDK